MSQPAREFIVKIVEMSLWSSDFLLGHVLLIILTPPTLIPFFDKLHSMMLCEMITISLSSTYTDTYLVWLRPSKQIRPPLFSTKQKRQRRWIVSKRGSPLDLYVSDHFVTGFQVYGSLHHCGRFLGFVDCLA